MRELNSQIIKSIILKINQILNVPSMKAGGAGGWWCWQHDMHYRNIGGMRLTLVVELVLEHFMSKSQLFITIQITLL